MINILGMICAILAIVSGVVLIFKSKVVVDSHGNPTEVEIPFFGKLKTNAPSIVAIFIGAALAGYVVHIDADRPLKVALKAQIKADKPAGFPVILGAVPLDYFVTGSEPNPQGVFELTVPVVKNGSYGVIVVRPVEVTEDGKTAYSVTTGQARIDGDGYLYAGELR